MFDTDRIPEGLDSPAVFLCHATDDKSAVRELHFRLRQDGFKPWLDEVDLWPGQEWETAIRQAVRDADYVAVCLSKRSTTKKGFVQKEIKIALDVADEQPEGTIYIIPARLEPCDVPDRISKWQAVNLFDKDGYSRMARALTSRCDMDSIIQRFKYAVESLQVEASDYNLIEACTCSRKLFNQLVLCVSGGGACPDRQRCMLLAAFEQCQRVIESEMHSEMNPYYYDSIRRRSYLVREVLERGVSAIPHHELNAGRYL